MTRLWHDPTVQASKNPEYLRWLADQVHEFREALVRFLELHVQNTSVARGMAPAVWPRDDADPQEIAARARRVSLAAGRAAAAPRLTGGVMRHEVAGVLDPIAAWQTMTMPKPLVEPDEVLDMCEQIIGRLEGLTVAAEAEKPPEIGAEAMHPVVWGAKRLWSDGHFRQAVAGAAEAVVGLLKNRVQRNDVAETTLWQDTFSGSPPASGHPRLRWPGNPDDRNVRTMIDGLKFYAAGVQMTIRNTATHLADDLSAQDAVERLAALSLLARWVDECDLLEADPDTPAGH